MTGLPVNLDAERLVLGSILLDHDLYLSAASTLKSDDFSLQKHRLMFRRMGEIQDRGEHIDRVTLANELTKHRELEACDGVSYLVSLDDGLPRFPNLDSYLQILKEKSQLRGLIFIGQKLMSEASLSEKSPAEISAELQRTLLKLGEKDLRAKLVSAADALENLDGGLMGFLDPSRRVKGIKTGFVRLDEMTGGLHDGELFVLAGRPSVGKTALALNIAQWVGIKLGLPTAIFSMEMSRELILQRLVCAVARVDSHKFRLGILSPQERHKLHEALTRIHDSPIYIDDSPVLSLVDLSAKLRRHEQENGKLALVVVDYLQLMRGRAKSETRTQEVSELTRGVKILAGEMKIPILLLSQLSRAVEQRKGDHRPQLSDLKESGSIEQDADAVAFVFREELYHRDREDLRGLAELILGKQRNGPIGTVNLVFLHGLTKFENRAEDYQEELIL